MKSMLSALLLAAIASPHNTLAKEAPPTPATSSHPAVDPQNGFAEGSPVKHPTARTRDSWLLRAGPELSRSRYIHEYTGGYVGAGSATYFDSRAVSKHYDFGGRLEVGYSLVEGRGVALVPFASAAVSWMAAREHRVQVVGVDHEFTSSAFQWSMAGGLELQMLDRALRVNAALGAGDISERVTGREPSGLEVKSPSTPKPLARLGGGIRLPTAGPWGGGVMVVGEAFGGFTDLFGDASVGSGTRLSLNVFVEWDGGRP